MTPDHIFALAQTNQPDPVSVPGAVSCHELAIARVSSSYVKALLRGRQAIGLARHGALTASNGRSAFTDLMQGLGDAIAYAVQHELDAGEDMGGIIDALEGVIVELVWLEGKKPRPLVDVLDDF